MREKHLVAVDIAKGVRPSGGHVTFSEAAKGVASLAETARDSGTFGVGGLLLGLNGKVYAEATNAVITEGMVYEPTSHAERQLIDWYFRMRGTLDMPNPSELLIVSSLTPCPMCAGSALKSGFSILGLSEDQRGGIHEGGSFRMPKELHPLAEIHFPLPAGRDLLMEEYFVPSRRNGQNGVKRAIERAGEAHLQSVATVRSYVHSQNGPGTVNDLRGVIRDSKALMPHGMELPPYQMSSVTDAKRAELSRMLASGKTCLVDHNGTPLLLANHATDESPIRDSMLELLRGYSALREAVRKEHGMNLPIHKNFSVLRQAGPDSPEEALFQLGTIGSLLGGTSITSKIALLTYLEGNDAMIKEFLGTMPPSCTDHERFSAMSLSSQRAGPG